MNDIKYPSSPSASLFPIQKPSYHILGKVIGKSKVISINS